MEVTKKRDHSLAEPRNESPDVSADTQPISKMAGKKEILELIDTFRSATLSSAVLPQGLLSKIKSASQSYKRLSVDSCIEICGKIYESSEPVKSTEYTGPAVVDSSQHVLAQVFRVDLLLEKIKSAQSMRGLNPEATLFQIPAPKQNITVPVSPYSNQGFPQPLNPYTSPQTFANQNSFNPSPPTNQNGTVPVYPYPYQGFPQQPNPYTPQQPFANQNTFNLANTYNQNQNRHQTSTNQISQRHAAYRVTATPADQSNGTFTYPPLDQLPNGHPYGLRDGQCTGMVWGGEYVPSPEARRYRNGSMEFQTKEMGPKVRNSQG